jgi:threonine dehydrogenase-like Zn-dependent dehydrogenase
VVVVGAGTSALIASLLARGYHSIIAVDISAAALEQLREQLGAASSDVRFMQCDVRELDLGEMVDVWHDRATFHFLTTPVDQAAYVERAAQSVRAGGHLVLAGFAPTGPEQCSGLAVAHHRVDDLTSLFADHFELIESFERDHVTPWGGTHRFTHTLFRRTG